MNAVDLAYEMVEAFEAAGDPYVAPIVALAASDHGVTTLLVEVWDEAAQNLILIGVTDSDARLEQARQYARETAAESDWGAMCYALSPSGWTGDGMWVDGWLNAPEDWGDDMIDSEQV